MANGEVTDHLEEKLNDWLDRRRNAKGLQVDNRIWIIEGLVRLSPGLLVRIFRPTKTTLTDARKFLAEKAGDDLFGNENPTRTRWRSIYGID